MGRGLSDQQRAVLDYLEGRKGDAYTARAREVRQAVGVGTSATDIASFTRTMARLADRGLVVSLGRDRWVGAHTPRLAQTALSLLGGELSMLNLSRERIERQQAEVEATMAKLRPLASKPAVTVSHSRGQTNNKARRHGQSVEDAAIATVNEVMADPIFDLPAKKPKPKQQANSLYAEIITACETRLTKRGATVEHLREARSFIEEIAAGVSAFDSDSVAEYLDFEMSRACEALGLST
jgi:hypothetical protein